MSENLKINNGILVYPVIDSSQLFFQELEGFFLGSSVFNFLIGILND